MSHLIGKGEKTWAISQVSGAGSHYIGGFYVHKTADDFSTPPTLGSVNTAYGAHVYILLAVATVDTLTIRVTGTSVTDAGGSRDATPDIEDIVFTHPTAVDVFRETAKKWIGAVTISVVSGTAKNCNYGWAKYWDANNSGFTLRGVEATFTGGANDPAPNILVRHHKATGWTSAAAGLATPPAAVADMQTDYNTEYQIQNGEEGAWKRDDLTTYIHGGEGEGTIVELVTTAGSGKTFEIGNMMLRVRT